MKAKYPVFGNPEAHIPDSFEVTCYENALTYIEKFYELDEQLANTLIENTGSIVNASHDDSVDFNGYYDKNQRTVTITINIKATREQILASLVSEFVSQFIGLCGKDYLILFIDTLLSYFKNSSEQDISSVLKAERMNDGTYRLDDKHE